MIGNGEAPLWVIAALIGFWIQFLIIRAAVYQAVSRFLREASQGH